jgi:23S rRNA (cytosine1962-C5)-methyltransferase
MVLSMNSSQPHLIRLLPGRDRRVKAGHPWAFSNEIAMTPAAKALPPGSLVRLEGDDGVKHGVWHFNPHSLISARRLDSNSDAACDLDWFKQRLQEALTLRQLHHSGGGGGEGEAYSQFQELDDALQVMEV